MATDFVENGDAEFADQLKAHAQGMDLEGAGLGFIPAEIQVAHDDANFWDWLVLEQEIVQHYGQDFTKYKNLARDGGTEPLGALPPVPVYQNIPPMVDKGIEQRFRDRAAKAKGNHAVYNQSKGEILRIVAVKTPFDPNVGKPRFRVVTVAGRPDLFFLKGGWDAVEIWKDINAQGWQKKERWDNSPWSDPDPLPAPGQSAVWKYKMVYIFKNKQVATWSDEVIVTVYGQA